jgi:hypothetical protein
MAQVPEGDVGEDVAGVDGREVGAGSTRSFPVDGADAGEGVAGTCVLSPFFSAFFFRSSSE